MQDADPRRPSKAFSMRYAKAERFRYAVEDDIEEALLFIDPGREHDFDEAQQSDPDDDVYEETFLSVPEDLALDFASDLVTYYCPSENRWTEFAIDAAQVDGFEQEALDIVGAREEALWEMIEASNFNDVSSQIMFEANHGTVAMWVEQSHYAQPFHAEAVPPHELLITPGFRGYLDRFRERWVMSDQLEVTFGNFPGVDLSDQRIQNKIKASTPVNCKVVWGFWLDWTDPADPQWIGEIVVDNIAVLKSTGIGPMAGSCPLLVGRFNPKTNRPWGRGPAIKALPELRKMDRLDEAVMDGLDQALHSTLIYANDGALDLSEGIHPDRAYPAGREFNRNNIFEMNRQVQLDTGLITQEQLEERVRACFYQDGPRQRGDTPPTAAQWLDERRRVQRRIGKPSAPLWSEFFLPFIQRIERLGVEQGRFEASVTINGNIVKINPVSPLQKSQNQDDILTTQNNLQTGAAVFGEAFLELVDGVATMENIKKASGDDLLVLRKPENAPPPADA